MNVLLSIHPEHAENILNGTKKYEFRKMLFKRENINNIIIYATSPIKKILGEFEIDSIISETPESLWELTHFDSGIKYNDFSKYFSGKNLAHAIKIKNFIRYNSPLLLSDVTKIKQPPQSFYYIK